MRMLILLTSLFLLATFNGTAQPSAGNNLSGKVTDSATGKPLTGVSVFLNNTSKGTITHDDGSFTLENIPAGSYDLVVSSISYATYVTTINGSRLPPSLHVTLHRQAEELTSVTVAPDLRHGWRDWGNFFIDNFIGKIPNAAYCHILNRKVLRFYYSKKNDRLSVRATEPLLIQNDALGYILEYRLESFTADFRAQIVSYFGYPFFREIQTKREGRRLQWEENREIAYTGSMMHFIRSLYFDQLMENGFVVTKEISIPNEGKRRITLNTDSLLTIAADQTKTFSFTGRLNIMFRASSYEKQSTLQLTDPRPITIEENGQYYPPDVILTSGSWGQNEKVGNLLPLDYAVPQKTQPSPARGT